MTLQETAQILGGIGVIASMIYVGIRTAQTHPSKNVTPPRRRR